MSPTASRVTKLRRLMAGMDLGVAESMAALARQLSDIEDLEVMLNTVAHAAVDSVPGAEFAAISQVRNKRVLEPRVFTDELVRRLNELQSETGEGPCMSAIYGPDPVVRARDFDEEQRFPKFARAAAELGVSSGMSFRLFAGRQVTGSLSLFSKVPDAFDDDAVVMGELFATHAGIALRSASNDSDFNEALRNRDVIGQAKGLLIERFKITENQAFAMLVDFSQREHVKLRDVAAGLMQDAQARPAT
jgi:transcriptional regulator with GAF, ATPase, and Fis domain